MAPIRVHRAILIKDGGRERADVWWEGPNGYRVKTFTHGWGIELARLLCKDKQLCAKAVEGELDVAGVLDWDGFELDLVFKMDPARGRDTAEVFALSIHEL